MTKIKSVIDIFVSESFIARGRGERNEITMLYSEIVNRKPLKLLVDNPEDLKAVKYFMEVNKKAYVEDLIVTSRALGAFPFFFYPPS
jgi:hypothetical protein